MIQRTTLAAIFFMAILASSGWAQDLASEGCVIGFIQDDSSRGRFRVTWVKDAQGVAIMARVPVRELRAARLNFTGQTALPVFLQEEIADSVTARGYYDDKEGLNELRSRIVDAWQQQGFFKVRVDLTDTRVLDESPDTRTVAITAAIQAGRQYHLADIQFASTTSGLASPSSTVVTEGAGFSAAELRALFAIQQGDVFDTHKIQDGMAALRKAYGAKGFINMVVVPASTLDDQKNLVTLTLEIEEGKQFRIGRVELAGDDLPSIRLRLSDLGISTGEIFDATRVEEFERQRPSAALPDNFKLDVSERTVNENRGTVDLILRIDHCPAP